MKTIDDLYAQAFLEGLRARSVHTAASYGYCLARFLEAVAKPPDQIGVTDAARYLRALDGLSPASRAHHISAVRSFLRFLQGQGVIPTTPLDILRRPRVAITSMNRYITEEEAERLIEASKGISMPCYLAVVMFLLTGVRISELAHAEWRHLFRDPEGRFGLLVVGKGGRERVVKIRDDLFGVMCDARRRRSLPTDLNAGDRSPLVAKADGSHYHIRSLQNMVRKAVRAAALQKPVSAHWLRHSFATLAALGGAPAFQLQQDLGHSRLETSQRYVTWSVGLRESSVDKLPIKLTGNNH